MASDTGNYSMILDSALPKIAGTRLGIMQNIKAGHHANLIEQINSFVKFRWLLIELVVTEVKLRYRKSFLGVLWTLMNPILSALVLFFVFREIFRVRDLGDIDFFSYVYSGVILITYFTQTIAQGSEQLIAQSGILRRVNIPPAIFIVAKILGNLINFLFAFLPLALYVAATQNNWTFKLFLAPIIALSMSLIILPICLFLSVAYSYFRDLQQIVPILLSLVYYLTPVFYSLNIVGGQARQLMELSPLLFYLDSFRYHLEIASSEKYRQIIIISCIGILLTVPAVKFLEKNRIKAVFLS